MNNKDNINIKVNQNIKEETIRIFNENGLNITEAIELYLREIIKYNGIPFSLKLDEKNKTK